MKLTDQQVRTYREHGVLIAPGLLADDDLAPLITGVEAWIDERARRFAAEGRIRDTLAAEPFERRLAGLFAQEPAVAEGMDIMESRLRAMFTFMYNPSLLDAVASLIGPEISINPIQHIRAKMPASMTGDTIGNFQNVPWHQDAAVTWEEADPTEIVTCWIPLVNATEANGAMQVLPDVVQRGYLEHVARDGTSIDDACFPHDIEPVVAACPKGGVVFMSKYTPHRGLLNRSDTIRWSLDLRYQPVGQPTGRPFWPAFVARSRSRPDSVENDYDQWCSRWDAALAASKGVGWHRTIPVDQRIPSRG